VLINKPKENARNNKTTFMNTNMKQIKKRNVAEIKHCDKITMLRPLADYNNTLSKCTVKICQNGIK
jgi:hypothetical protein